MTALDPAYELSWDRDRLDVDAIHAALSDTYWASGRARATFERALAGSIPVGIYVRDGGAQAAFARIVSDRAVFAYLGDVIVLPEHRGRGLGKALVAAILAHPELQGLTRWQLATVDAQGLYAQFGFTPVARPEIHMERAPSFDDV
ncbi:GNAT family N-acetyltransferase [Patulibacter defluvii]|uniref:GNAT family N-acetyltransferase n=1 Tax=Patulibacter defluvii TaxID=3095358 RepID=UPI002A754290|nr:GNAT family N-acetyltransferase [Patulibacter sp. DM4]